jgi:outer membrane protein assembly factor BamB
VKPLARTILTTAIVAGSASLQAADDLWPQWRGPARTGIVPAGAAPTNWPAALKKGWSVPVGEGYSSPVTAGGRVFVHARRDPDEVVLALDLATGKVLWEQKYAAPVEKNPYAKQMAKGPYSTPLVAGSYVYTLGTTGILTAWHAPSGRLVWRKDFSSRIDTSKLFCGTAMSPVLTKRGIVVHVGDDRGGTVAAFDPATGTDVWTRAIDGPGYASPVELSLDGTAQLVTMTTRSVAGLAVDTGAVLWTFPFPDEWNENIVTPVATPTGIIVSGVRQGTRALTIAQSGGAWTVKQAWHTPDVAMYMSSPVLTGGVLFGHSAKRKGQFVAVNPADGRLRWSTEGRAGVSASVIATDKHLLFLTTESEFVVVALDGSAYKEQRRYTVASSPTYAHPILLRDRLIVRDATHVTSWGIP